MKVAIVLPLVLMTILSLSAASGDMIGFLEVSGKGESQIVNSALDRSTGFSRSEVLYGQGAIDYSAIGCVNDSSGVSQRNRTIEFPKGLLVNVQHMESSFVFNGTGLDMSNINVVSSYIGSDQMTFAPNMTSFDVKSEFDGTWDIEAFKGRLDRKIDTRTMMDGKFEIEKELEFKQFN